MINYREHEQKLILSFVLPQRQSRYLELLERPKRRKDITRSLGHFKHLDPRYIVPIAPREQHVPEILQLLKTKGAPELCYALSEDGALDGKELLLAEALGQILGRGIGTFLSCIPGKLAYFEDEDGRRILERRP
jgi:hypothetical protein